MTFTINAPLVRKNSVRRFWEGNIATFDRVVWTECLRATTDFYIDCGGAGERNYRDEELPPNCDKAASSLATFSAYFSGSCWARYR